MDMVRRENPEVKRQCSGALKKTRAKKPLRTAARAPRSSSAILFLFLAPLLFLLACSFDYGTAPAEDTNLPDIIMNDVEYVRVRKADPVVRFQAEQAERYEKRQLMELQNFSFEQFEDHGEEINAVGRAGAASVELDSGNIRLGDGVSLSVDSEDITIETTQLNWRDRERILSGNEDGEVNVFRENGTSFTGWGFTANTRNRTWEFSGGVAGSYIHDDDEEEESPEEDAGDNGDGEAGDGGEEAPEGQNAPGTEGPAGEGL
jgi:LPS export ABC transporter protein LptC